MGLPLLHHLTDRTWLLTCLITAPLIILLLFGNPRDSNLVSDLGDRVLVADFINDTGNAELGVRLNHALRISLEQSPALLLYPRLELQDSLRQTVLNPYGRLTPDVARDICLREKVPGFMLPRVIRFSDFYVASVAAVSVRNGSLQHRTLDLVCAKDDAQLVGAVEDMSRRVRDLYGERGRSPSISTKRLFPVPVSAADSAALQAFAEALTLDDRGSYALAIPRFLAAASLHPGFTLAESRLATLYAQLGWTALARQHASRAKQNADELPPLEKYRISGHYYLLERDYAQATREFRALAALYPRSAEGHVALGETALLAGDADDAVADFENACALARSEPQPFLRLCVAQLYKGRTAEARAAWEKASALTPDAPETGVTEALLQIMEGDLAAAMRTSKRVASHPEPVVASFGAFLLGQAQLYGGRFKAAVNTFEAAIGKDEQLGFTWSEADKRLAKAETHLLRGEPDRALQECRLMPDLSGDISRMTALADLLARAGQWRQATELAARIESGDPGRNRFYADLVRGDVALASGHPNEAVLLFRHACGLRKDPTARLCLASALKRAGALQEAAAEYEALSAAKAAILFPAERNWFMARWAGLLYDHADCLATLGKTGEARQQFRSFLWVFDSADADVASTHGATAFLRKRS
jgi:eukaryotic-like serine/threonine-protein kinase